MDNTDAKLTAFARALKRSERCVMQGDEGGLFKSMIITDRRLLAVLRLPTSLQKARLLAAYTNLVAGTGVSLSKSGKDEQGPSRKPPKEWVAKMKKRIGSGGKKQYSDEAKGAIMGNIWYNKMRPGHKAAVRKRFGKKYGPAKKSMAGPRLHIPAGK